VRTCCSLGVPLLVLVDVPGYLPGLEEEENGIVQRGAKLLRAFAEATVPRVTVILRKAYGGAFIAMNSRSLGATAVYAWPLAEVGIMYAANAVAVLHKRDLASASEGQRATLLRDLATEYSSDSGGLSLAVKRGVIDAIMDPSITPRMARAALTGTAS
jgi:acetyl-CoA/propionyl-CoA carboxylase carboxyl transferase subunit